MPSNLSLALRFALINGESSGFAKAPVSPPLRSGCTGESGTWATAARTLPPSTRIASRAASTRAACRAPSARRETSRASDSDNAACPPATGASAIDSLTDLPRSCLDTSRSQATRRVPTSSSSTTIVHATSTGHNAVDARNGSSPLLSLIHI